MARNLLKTLLRTLAVKILSKYQPEVIGITGSVGKSSTKEAVYAVLRTYFRARKSAGNYNTEIGLPLAIIGANSGGRSIFLWLAVLTRALRLLIFRDKKYPEILILEMGADRPGDIEYLVNFVKPKIGIITAIGMSHIEYFGTIERIAKEKEKLVSKLPKDGLAILNLDDEWVREMSNRAKAQVITYGFREEADVRALEIALQSQLLQWREDNPEIGGTAAKIEYKGNVVPLFLSNVLGKTHIYAALAATAVGIIKGLNLIEILEGLKNYSPPPGRLKILPGVKKTYLIDDTYNAAPASTEAALELLASIKIPENARKIAILGDMLELGSESEDAHRRIGQLAAKMGVDLLLTVGERAAGIGKGAKDAGTSENQLFHFASAASTGRFIQDRIKAGDLILVKGSQSMRMERAVKELMANPLAAPLLLVRQSPEWLTRP